MSLVYFKGSLNRYKPILVLYKDVFLYVKFTRAPESHACKGVDEWLSVRGFAPERNPESKEATAVRPWSFTLRRAFSRSIAHSA